MRSIAKLDELNIRRTISRYGLKRNMTPLARKIMMNQLERDVLEAYPQADIAALFTQIARVLG